MTWSKYPPRPDRKNYNWIRGRHIMILDSIHPRRSTLTSVLYIHCTIQNSFYLLWYDLLLQSKANFLNEQRKNSEKEHQISIAKKAGEHFWINTQTHTPTHSHFFHIFVFSLFILYSKSLQCRNSETTFQTPLYYIR